MVRKAFQSLVIKCTGSANDLISAGSVAIIKIRKLLFVLCIRDLLYEVFFNFFLNRKNTIMVGYTNEIVFGSVLGLSENLVYLSSTLPTGLDIPIGKLVLP